MKWEKYNMMIGRDDRRRRGKMKHCSVAWFSRNQHQSTLAKMSIYDDFCCPERDFSGRNEPNCTHSRR